MPEIDNQIKSKISNPAKILRGYMDATGIADAKTLSDALGIAIRTIQRLKLECATCANDAIYGAANDAKRARYGVSETPNAPDMALADAPSARADITTRATKESPTEISYSSKLASLPTDDVSELMITDIIAWMHGGDRRSAENWLSNTTKLFGNDATREGYHKLKTDLATGSVVARKLQAWTEISRRYKAKPTATANVVTFRPTDTSGRPLPTMSEVLARIAAEDAAHAAG